MMISLETGAALGRVLAAGRMLAGMDQGELAFASGVSAATISNVERGNDARPATIQAIRQALRKAGITVTFDRANGIASVAVAFEEPMEEDFD